MELIDTHCHLDSESFQQDLEKLVAAAHDAGVIRMITIGTDLASSQAARGLAERFDTVLPVVGIHPNYTSKAGAGDWQEIEVLAAMADVVGIGETGLDLYWKTVPLDLQQDYFQRHLDLSRRVGKPFVVHCRDAEPEVMEMLRSDFRSGPLHGVMHSFCGTPEAAAECIAMGMYVSIAGMVTYRKNDHLREMAATIPLDRILVETDAPYLSPHPNRGKRNQPAWVRFTAECLAEVHGITLDELAAATTRNARSVFGLN
ncbi:MAG: TatD family hydrolase [Planctomycetaceae bacterium]|nr:TatD family hydrolase [Planctomycetaceae bacterium]